MAAAKDQLLDAIRSLMAAHSPPLHALVVPSEDAHQVRPYLTLPPPPPPSRGGGGDLRPGSACMGWLMVLLGSIRLSRGLTVAVDCLCVLAERVRVGAGQAAGVHLRVHWERWCVLNSSLNCPSLFL